VTPPPCGCNAKTVHAQQQRYRCSMRVRVVQRTSCSKSTYRQQQKGQRKM
jgi:hypothetical protein